MEASWVSGLFSLLPQSQSQLVSWKQDFSTKMLSRGTLPAMDSPTPLRPRPCGMWAATLVHNKFLSWGMNFQRFWGWNGKGLLLAIGCCFSITWPESNESITACSILMYVAMMLQWKKPRSPTDHLDHNPFLGWENGSAGKLLATTGPVSEPSLSMRDPASSNKMSYT